MITALWTRRNLAFAVAMVALACAAGLARPTPMADSGMSAEWQCSMTAGVLMTCTKGHV
jgi:hypothetical protein